MTKGLHKNSLRKGEPNKWIVEDIIEQLKKILNLRMEEREESYVDNNTLELKNQEDRDIIEILDTIQEQSVCEGLKEEFKKWYNGIHKKVNVEHTMFHYMQECARHFYELGRQSKEQVCEDVSEDVEEAAEEYASDEMMSGLAERAFIAGAKWQKEQMMKEAVEVEVWDAGVDFAPHPVISVEDFNVKDGDKVRIIIVKED